MHQDSGTNKILESFFNSAPMFMGVVEITENDIIHISDNKSAAAFFGHDQKSLIGKYSSELGTSRDSIETWLRHYRKSQETNAPVRFEYFHETASGKRFYTSVVSFIGIAESGRPYFSYILQDTTEEKKNREDLQRQEVFVEAILEHIPDMIFVKEAKELRFVRFNKAGETLLGYQRSDLIGKNDYDFFPKEEADHFTSLDREVFKQKKMLEIQVEPIQTSHQGTRLLHTKKIPLLDNAGNPQYLVGISEDITEKLEAEKNKQKMFEEQIARQEAEKSLQAREEFISVASHELKSPISALKLQAEMFRNNIKNNRPDAYSPEKINKVIDLTEKEVARLDRLVNDMLDASRISSGNLTMAFAEFDLCALVNDLILKMKDFFVNSNCDLPVLTCTETTIVGHWDPMRIEQVMTNLFTNAVRYGQCKPFEVSITKNKNSVLIKVADRGMGIAADNLNKIFDRFERAIKRNEVSGLGLGLFISKQIVEAHKGKIWAESELGKGSTFYVELPL